LSQLSNASIHWRVEELVSEGVAWFDVFNPKSHDRDMVAARKRQLFLDFVAVVGRIGEDEDHRPGVSKRADDRFLVIFTGCDIARRDPTADAATLDRFADRQRFLSVGAGVADENWPRAEAFVARYWPRFIHRRPPASSENSRAVRIE
jgi:hypothetical protein